MSHQVEWWVESGMEIGNQPPVLEYTVLYRLDMNFPPKFGDWVYYAPMSLEFAQNLRMKTRHATQ